MDFREREGHKKPKHNPLESMDSSLKNAIWTVIYTHINNRYISWGITGYGDSAYKDVKAKNLWTDFFGQKISSCPYAGKYLDEIEELYAKLEWHEVYGLIEFFLEQNEHFNPEEFNKALIKHNAAYRVIDSIVQPISDKEVITAMESAHNNSLSEEIRGHLRNAQTLYSSKQNPDFTNSCLESIKAVEGTCRVILNNTKKLGDNIKELNKSKNHSQHIISALEKINAFRGNDVAHAKKEDSHTPTREDAILIHTICCGFVNYFKSKKQDK
jgi:hypothetical protein